MRKIFRQPKFSETLKVSPTKYFALSDKKFSRQNSDSPSPYLLSRTFFRYQEISETQKGTPT